MFMSLLSNEAVEQLVNLSKELKFAVEFETTKDLEGTKCDTCGGHGRVTCATCEGTGHVTYYYLPAYESYRYSTRDSFVESHDDTCPTCDGDCEIDCDECDGEPNCSDLSFPWDEVKDEHCGSELVTGAMDWARWSRLRPQLKSDLHEAISADRSTGGHTHVDWSWVHATGREFSTFRNITRLIRVMDERIQELLGTNPYRRTGSFTPKYENHKGYGVTSDQYFENMYQAFIDNEMKIYPKYSWLNVRRVERSSSFHYNTLEFRVWDSTNDVRVAERNVAYSQAFVLFAHMVNSDELKAMIETYTDGLELAEHLHETFKELAYMIVRANLGDSYINCLLEA